MNTYQRWAEYKLENAQSKPTRSFSEQMFPIYICMFLFMTLIHLASFASAVVYPSYQFKVMTGSSVWGLIIGGVIVMGLEVMKYVLYKASFENYHADVTIRQYWGMVLGCVLFTAVSIFLSTSGVQLLNKYFNPNATTVDTTVLAEKHNDIIAMQTAVWQSKVDEATKARDDYYKSNKKPKQGVVNPKENKPEHWRLSSARAIQIPYGILVKQVNETNTAMITALGVLETNKTNALYEARTGNTSATEKHDSDVNNAKAIGSAIMLSLEFSYIICFLFLTYYTNRSEKEQELEAEAKQSEVQPVPTAKQSEAEANPTQSNPKQPKATADTGVLAPQTARSMQIQTDASKHGSVFKPANGRVEKMHYQKANGEFRTYSKSELKRLAKDSNLTDEKRSKLNNLINSNQWSS